MAGRVLYKIEDGKGGEPLYLLKALKTGWIKGQETRRERNVFPILLKIYLRIFIIFNRSYPEQYNISVCFHLRFLYS